jgi:DeoR family suf operon transcriptional repressor
VPLVAELLSAKGYMAETVRLERPVGQDAGRPAEQAGAEATPLLTLRIHNCAVREIAERFPQACAVEEKFVERLLGVPLVRHAHRLDGCGHCEYGVSGHLSTVKQEQA